MFEDFSKTNHYFGWVCVVTFFVTWCDAPGKYTVIIDGIDSEDAANAFADHQRGLPSPWDDPDTSEVKYEFSDARVIASESCSEEGFFRQYCAGAIRIFVGHVSLLYG